MTSFVLVGLGGAIGSMARYSCIKYLPTSFVNTSTLFANVIACFLLGIILNKYNGGSITEDNKLWLSTGFCGGMSTFSTLIFEIFQYQQRVELYQGILYLTVSVTLGFVALLIGIKFF